MKIRRAVEADYAGVERLVRQLQREHAAGRPDLYRQPEQPMPIETYREWMKLADHGLYVAGTGARGREEEIAAYLFYSLEITPGSRALVARRTLFIRDLAVDESMRRRGIGRRLIAFAQDEAKRMGADSVELHVSGFNRGAADFYAEMGFGVKQTRLEYRLHQEEWAEIPGSRSRNEFLFYALGYDVIESAGRISTQWPFEWAAPENVRYAGRVIPAYRFRDLGQTYYLLEEPVMRYVEENELDR